MRKLVLPVLLLTALSACSQKAKNEAAEANEQVAGDSNVMGEAVSDVNAANAAVSEPIGNEAEELPVINEASGDEGSGDE